MFQGITTLIFAVEDLNDCISIWSFDGNFLKLQNGRFDSTTDHSFERSSPALLCYLIESAFARNYSCDYITKRYRRIDKDENPLYYLALIFLFVFPPDSS